MPGEPSAKADFGGTTVEHVGGGSVALASCAHASVHR
jgi:hypothetical protein